MTSGFSPGVGTVVKRVPYGSPIAKVAAHAMTGGTLAHLQGGKFGHGFASAGFTQALSPVVGQMEGGVLGRTAASAVIGGTASKMTGGSFASGAQTGAFSSLFNDTVHLCYQPVQRGGWRSLRPGELSKAQSAIGEGMDFGVVRIWNRLPYSIVRAFVNEENAVVPNERDIFMGSEVYSDDFSGNEWGMGFLVHELVHIWQHQNYPFVIPARNYNYSGAISSDGGWRAMNIEMQADVVQDLYLLEHGYQAQRGLPLGFPPQVLRDQIPFSVPFYDNQPWRRW